MKVVNLFGDEWDRRRERPGWQWSEVRDDSVVAAKDRADLAALARSG